jgi:hypothetical protein
MVKLAPAPNDAARAIRDNGLVGLAQIVVGILGMAASDERFVKVVALLFVVMGALTILPSLIARGIRLERESRDSAN